jgi:hypothetical protein
MAGMSADFIVFAVVVVCLLYWIGTNVHAIAKRGEPAHDPGDRPLTWRERWILSKRDLVFIFLVPRQPLLVGSACMIGSTPKA